MICEHYLTIHGEISDHVIRLRFDLTIGRPAPRTSNPDGPGFGDPGEPGGAAIKEAWLCRPALIQGDPHTERRLSRKIVARLREHPRIESELYYAALNSSTWIPA